MTSHDLMQRKLIIHLKKTLKNHQLKHLSIIILYALRVGSYFEPQSKKFRVNDYRLFKDKSKRTT